MKQRKYFIVGIIVLFGLSALDLLSTWILTPGLENETNAFVGWYGFGWVGIILISLAMVVFISIPFYYHCLVFNHPAYNEQRPSLKRIISDYFIRNHKNPLISVIRALFNGLGYFLFWWYVIHKLAATIHNGLSIANAPFWKMPFIKKVMIMDRVILVFLVIMMVLFFARLIYRAKNNRNYVFNTKSIHPVMVAVFVCLYISFRLFTSFAKPVHSVELTQRVDPEIVLINIEHGDRAYIADLLLTIDSCKPALIALDVIFVPEKNDIFDSILMNAFSTVQNDLIAYGFDSTGKIEEPQVKFSALTREEGFVGMEEINGLQSHITPIQVINNKMHEHFALKVVKVWKPGFKHTLRINQSIPIRYIRRSQQYIHVNGSNIHDVDPEFLKNKLVLLGYLGPTKEDKHYTPIRLRFEYPVTEPDTYGLVIVANAIRTILHYEKKD